jgi:hypothetical protein
MRHAAVQQELAEMSPQIVRTGHKLGVASQHAAVWPNT